MRRLSLRSLLVPSLALASGIAACGGDTSGSGGSTLQYYLTADPPTLDPALSTDVQSGEVVATLFDNLVQFDVNGQVVPGLATRWETDSTGRIYTFHLRTGARFHDGRPVTARDAEASVVRALRPGGKGGRQWPLLPIQGADAFAAGSARTITGIQVPDDSTIVFTLKEPLNIFPKFMAMPVAAVVPATVSDSFAQHPVGSGPWTFVSWRHDDAIVVARNPNYWGGPPKADSLRIRIIPEALTQAAEYESGRLDVVEIPFSETQRWTQTHGSEIQRRPTIRDLYISMTTTRGPLKDVRVRRALNMGVDVSTMLATIMSGRGVRAAGAIPPGIAGFDSSRAPYRHDPDAARRLLAEAGYPNGFAIKLWRSQRPELARIAQSVQQDLGRIGVKVEIIERDAPTVRATVRNGEADLYLGDWYADYPDPENFTYPLFHSANKGSGGNYAFLSDPALDSMIIRLRTTTDDKEKASLARQVDARVFDQAAWIFLWFPIDMWATRLEGWHIPAVFNAQRWTEARQTK
ncbi:MAG: ABC transporter substrate-binding protein [Gemmatimonadota bacterium]